MFEHIRLQKLHTICRINEFRENKLSNRSYFKHPESSPQLYPAQRNPSPHRRCQAATLPPPSPGAASGSAHSSRPPPLTVVSAPTKQTAPPGVRANPSGSSMPATRHGILVLGDRSAIPWWRRGRGRCRRRRRRLRIPCPTRGGGGCGRTARARRQRRRRGRGGGGG